MCAPGRATQCERARPGSDQICFWEVTTAVPRLGTLLKILFERVVLLLSAWAAARSTTRATRVRHQETVLSPGFTFGEHVLLTRWPCVCALS
jgi:hypothetical protein